MSDLTRLGINITAETKAALKREAALTDGNVTDAVQTAVYLLDWYRKQTAKGNLILIEEPDGSQYRVLLPAGG